MFTLIFCSALLLNMLVMFDTSSAQDNTSPPPATKNLKPPKPFNDLKLHEKRFQAQQKRINEILSGNYEVIPGGKSLPEIYNLTPDDDAEIRLMKQQINCLYVEVAILNSKSHNVPLSEVYDAVIRLSEARFEYHKDPKTRLTILREKLAAAESLQKFANYRAAMLTSLPPDDLRATSTRIQIQIELLRFIKAHPEVDGNVKVPPF